MATARVTQAERQGIKWLRFAHGALCGAVCVVMACAAPPVGNPGNANDNTAPSNDNSAENDNTAVGNPSGDPADTGDAVLDDLSRELGALAFSGDDFAADRAAMQAVFDRCPQIVASGVDDELGSVWAHTADGEVLAVVHNRSIEPWPTGMESFVGEDRDVSVARQPTGAIPGSVRAAVFNMLREADQNATDSIAAMLADKGYAVPESLYPGFADLTDIDDVGVLYIAGHSATIIETDGTPAFYLVTSIAVDLATDSVFAEDLDFSQNRHTMVKVHPTNGILANGRRTFLGWRYAINHRFVEKYWRFDPNALVFINSCASDNGLAQAFRDACLRADGGAATYLGWTGLVENNDAAAAGLFVFDRTLGVNRFWLGTTGTLLQARTPRMRPMALNFIFTDTKPDSFPNGDSAGLKYNESTGQSRGGVTLISNLRVERRADVTELPLLAPSIAFVEVDEARRQLHVINSGGGGFGVAPAAGSGQVTIGGRALEIVSWTSDEIIATIGSADVGEVRVHHRGRPSNPRYLTRFGGISYDWTFREIERPNRFINAHWEGLSFRADVDETWSFPASPQPTMLQRSYPMQPVDDGSPAFSYSVGGTDLEELMVCRETYVSNNGTATLRLPPEFPHTVEDNTFTVFILQVQNEGDRIDFIIEPRANIPEAYRVELTHVTMGTSCGGGTLALGGPSSVFADPLTLDLEVSIDPATGWPRNQQTITAADLNVRVDYDWSAPSSVTGSPDRNAPK